MEIFWIDISKLKYREFFKEITKFEEQNIVFTPNPEILLKAKNDKEFSDLLNKANFLIPDWIWLYVAFQVIDFKKRFSYSWRWNIEEKKQNVVIKYIVWKIFDFLRWWRKIVIYLALPYFIFNLFFRRKYLYSLYWDRICWSDLTKDILKYAQKNDIRVSIIDLFNPEILTPEDEKKQEIQDTFVEQMQQKFKDLKIDYYIYDLNKKDQIIDKIKESDSKILFSTLWMKKQERSVIEILESCENIKLWMWIWSSFDYFTWFQKRAPKIWSKLWIEWLYRLIFWQKKFERLKRIWNAIFDFTYEVIKG